MAATLEVLEAHAVRARLDIEGLKELAAQSRVDIGELKELAAQSRVDIGELKELAAQSRANLDRHAAQSRAEMAALRAEMGELGRHLSELSDRADRRSAEADRRSAEADRRSAEADRRIAKLEIRVDETTANVNKLARTVAEVTKQMGGIHNSIGDIVEIVIVPGLRKRMNKFEHNFTTTSTRKKFAYPSGKILSEVDLLLENCEAVMAVEVKRSLTVKHVSDHLARLLLMRKYEGTTGLVGKALYAAVAGIDISDHARRLAEGSGMYVIAVDADTMRMKIVRPAVSAVW